MADAKLTGLAENTAPLVTDILYIVDDPAITAVSQKITVANLFAATNATLALKADKTTTISSVVKSVTGATYTLLATDGILHVSYTATGAVTITVPTAQITATRLPFDVKDAGGNATANNITIVTEGAETIDGEANAVISTSYNSLTLYSDGTNLFIK